MNWKSVIYATGFAASVLAAPAMAQTVKWDMANEYADTSIHGQAQAIFTETAKEASGGSIEITNHFGGAIGYKSKEHFDAVGDGALPIANTSMGQVAGIEPIFLLSSLPFLVGSADDAKLLWDVARPHYEAVFARNNQVLLYASPWPPAGIWAKKPVTSKEELSGVKVRAWDASGTSTLKSAGAAAIQMSWADVVPQLAAGGIDAVLTSAEGGTNSKFWEHLSHFTAINYSMSLNMTHVNKDSYDALTDDQRAALHAAADRASEAAWGALADRVAGNYSDMEANKITVIREAPKAFLAGLSEAGKPVYADWLEKVGPVGQQILDEYRAKRGF
ncbi:TRAP transporter substrate-binding protein [Pelagibius sp. Alg239-R121]|uniref:TRAP transporter substrate-binding protein n=1 Tax=Pelagibius sp. Alg239-R121 TaxID=2993448 RepID=UPI0024A65EAF|nr:TRAP transporter substrate-binding protein [Pelagibius sp. Alg239-R121]